MEGWGAGRLWLSPEAGDRERGLVTALARGLDHPGWSWEEHGWKRPLTFHVGGNRQKQIFHGLIKSFKLTEFL